LLAALGLGAGLADRRARRIVERSVCRDASAAKRRRQSAENRGDERHDKREGEHAAADLNRRDSRDRRWNESSERSRRGDRDSNSEQTGGEGDQRAFGQQLSHDRARFGAERRADGELLLPRSGAREHEVRHVGTSDEQHRTHGGKEHDDGTAHVAEQRGAQRQNGCAEAGIFFWMLLLLFNRVFSSYSSNLSRASKSWMLFRSSLEEFRFT
jgi:hypothetical protein